MNKEKKVAFIIFACFFLISSVALLIWDTKTGDEKDFFLPLLLLIGAITCAILFVLKNDN